MEDGLLTGPHDRIKKTFMGAEIGLFPPRVLLVD